MSTSRLVAAMLAAAAIAAFPAYPQAAEVHPRPSCYACLVVDPAGDQVLLSRRADVQLPNASTTKMVTALVVRAAAQLDEVVTVSPAAAATGGGGLALEAGDRYSVGDLLAALLMTSSNDAAVALAEHVSGSERRFARRMNRMAGELGAPESHFVSAHGLDAPGHTASAADLATVAERVVADPVLAAMAGALRARLRGPDGVVPVENRNPLLESYPGAIGVKTGFTAAAGNVLVAAARREGRLLIAVAMRSRDAVADTSVLLDRGFARLARTPLLRAGTPVSTLVFDPSGATPVVAGSTVRGLQDPSSVTVRFRPDPHARPPFVAGQVVGSVGVWDASGAPIGSVPARAQMPVGDEAAPWTAELLASLLRFGYRIAELARGT